MRAHNIAEQRFGRLVTIQQTRRAGKRAYLCQCDCGNRHVVIVAHLIDGRVRSCGCLRNETSSISNTTHGEARTRLYRIWSKIKYRCKNQNCKDFAHYGGRGIFMCDEWASSFEQFKVDMGPRPAGYTVERIDNDGPYAPWNCKWASRAEQGRNRRPKSPTKKESANVGS